MRFKFDPEKSDAIRRDRRRGIGLEDASQIFERPYYQEIFGEDPAQWRVIGWVEGRLFTLVYEERQDLEGDYLHLVTMWPSSREERRIYEHHF